jgi:hypothetical protein
MNFICHMHSVIILFSLALIYIDFLFQIFVVLHEMLHRLGAIHEQRRGDRDRYLTVLWNNVKPGGEYDFTRVLTYNHNPYDVESIMQYWYNVRLPSSLHSRINTSLPLQCTCLASTLSYILNNALLRDGLTFTVNGWLGHLNLRIHCRDRVQDWTKQDGGRWFWKKVGSQKASFYCNITSDFISFSQSGWFRMYNRIAV